MSASGFPGADCEDAQLWSGFFQSATANGVVDTQILIDVYEDEGEEAFATMLVYKFRERKWISNLEAFTTEAKVRMVEGFDLFRETLAATKTIAQVLAEISPTDFGTDFKRNQRGFRNIAVHDVDAKNKVSPAYFVVGTGSNISFRHNGDYEQKPSTVYLQKFPPDVNGKVLVFYSASGTGKTVDLAASGFTRNAHVTIMLTFSAKDEVLKNYEGDAAEFTGELKASDGSHLSSKESKERHSRGLNLEDTLSCKLSPVVDDFREGFERLFKASADTKEDLNIVIAIDEAATCPNLVRAIIRDSSRVHEMVFQCFFDNAFPPDGLPDGFSRDTLNVKVSLGGTGIATSDIGSFGDTYHVVTPYREQQEGRKIVQKSELRKLSHKTLLLNGGPKTLDSIDRLSYHLPVVATLMENGRLGSIAFRELHEQDSLHPVQESILVDKIVRGFMLSNGMQELVTGRKKSSSRQKVAATALAVPSFFQNHEIEVPKEKERWNDFLRCMPFYPLNEVCMLEIVATYGLLEPTGVIKISEVKTIQNPLKMTTAQQLVAIHMMGIGLNGMLSPSSGFELFSTHLIKCAIASSLAVNWAERPSLQKTLQGIGFVLDKHACDSGIEGAWKELDEYRAISSSPDEMEMAQVERRYVSETFQLSVELEIDEVGNCIYMDGLLHRTLKCLKAADEYGAPVSFVNYRNSPLPDGFVVCYASKKDSGSAPLPEKSERFAIMNQAKDYHGSTSLPMKDLRTHAKRSKNSRLDAPLGQKRLLAVSSSHDSLLSKKAVQEQRSFVPFVTKNGKLLKELMTILDERRSKEFRRENFSLKWDSPGEPSEAVSPNKRHKSGHNIRNAVDQSIGQNTVR